MTLPIGRWTLSGTLMLWVAGLLAPAYSGQPETIPLHQRIDALVAEGLVIPPAGRADDATFLRRVHLDLVGTVPTGKEARAFLADDSPTKRAAIVERLLARPDHARHLATSFDVWLMERRPDIHVKSPGWKTFLEAAFAANRPYHEIVAEILAADGTDDRNRDAARFYLDRLGEPNLLTRDVGRLFFGRDLQCAQCHDHPNIPDYLQRDYHGLYAFFGRTYLFQPDKKQPAVLGEKAAGGGEFKSVFTEVEATSLPRVPLGKAVYADPPLSPGEEYRVKPDPKDKKVQPIPAYSRRDRVADAVTKSDNEAFNRNIANRLWAFMMGRGLVEPLDFHHASNPPTHPELLSLLADEFSRMNYDIRAFLRELALSETYQRKSEMPSPSLADSSAPSLADLEAEETRLRHVSQETSDRLDSAKTAWIEARKTAIGPETAWKTAEQKRIAAAEALAQAGEALAAAEQSRDEVIARTVEGKTDPQREKLEAAVKAAREKAEAAKTALTDASTAAEKLRPAAEAEESKVARVADSLGSAQQAYDAAKSAWKLAQRKADDARALANHVALATGVSADRSQLDRQLEKQRAEADRLRKLADRLETTAIEAQALREEFLEDDDLVLAAAVLGERSLAAEAKAAAAEQALADTRTALDTASADPVENREKEAASLEELTERWARSFAVGSFIHLTPEQFCAAMLEATGEREKYRAAGEAEFTKKLADQQAAKEAPKKNDEKKEKPETPLEEKDRDSYLDRYVRDRVEATTKQFISLFGGEAGLPQGDFFATADQALFLANAGTLRGWLRPSGDNLTARLLKLEDPEALANELYLCSLTRRPDPDEIAAVTDYLAARGDQRSEAVQELGWALLSSVEFRFKH